MTVRTIRLRLDTRGEARVKAENHFDDAFRVSRRRKISRLMFFSGPS